jgi:hypothetical protein
MKGIILRGFCSMEPNFASLDDILSAFLEMIEQKRVAAVSIYTEFGNWEEPPEWKNTFEFYPPWTLMDDDEKDLEVTLSAWEGLLSAIEAQ